MPKVIATAKEKQAELQTYYDANQIVSQLFSALKSGRITGDVKADSAFIGEYQAQIAQQVFPAIYKKGYSKQLYGFYAKDFVKISKDIRNIVTQRNNMRMGNLNHIYKLESIVYGLKNPKFKKHLLEFIYAVDRTTPKYSVTSIGVVDNGRTVDLFDVPPLKTSLFNFGDKQSRSLKEILSDIKQRTDAYDEIIDTILSKMKGDTVVRLNMHVSYMGQGVTITDKSGRGASKVYIAYSENNDESDFMHTVVHEAIHVATVSYLMQHPEL